MSGAHISNGEATALMHDATAASGHGVTFSLGGDVVDQAETPYGGASNGVGVGAATIVLLIAFGSLLAMGLPIATALMGIGSGLSLIALLGHVFPAPVFSAIVAAMIGLGVGVDYALFIVTRFRGELHEGAPPARRAGDRDAHRGPCRAHRGHHGRHRHARAARAAPVAAERRRDRGRGHGRDDRARLAHAAARAARLQRHPAGQAVAAEHFLGGKAFTAAFGPESTPPSGGRA